jgi:hypothetical protein
LAVEQIPSSIERNSPFLDGNADEIVPEGLLPFIRFKLPPEEEALDAIRTSKPLRCLCLAH